MLFSVAISKYFFFCAVDNLLAVEIHAIFFSLMAQDSVLKALGPKGTLQWFYACPRQTSRSYADHPFLVVSF